MYNATIKDKSLTLESSDGKTILKEKVDNPNDNFKVFGVYGIIEFNSRKYLVLISKALKKGTIGNKDVFEATGAKALRIESNSLHNDSELVKNTIENFFNYKGLYFSDYELCCRYKLDDSTANTNPIYKGETSSVQNIKGGLELGDVNSSDKSKVSMQSNRDIELYNTKISESVFLFNRKPIGQLLAHFTDFNFENRAILKCIQGYFSSFNEFVLISRRSPKRIGARYFSRGIGDEGFPSNFVETEQIIMNKSSYLQVRGSIPLKWNHSLNFKYHPRINILPSQEQFLISCKILEKIYKMPIIYLNLIKSKGYESEIYRKYNEHVKNSKVLFYNFDFKNEFHKNKMPFDLARCGFATKTQKQNEIIRTNCIDCLDRTNSMQYRIGKAIFKQQLDDAKITDQNAYEEAFKKAFYENGNNISLQYAGTNAMSSFYITDGKKHTRGLLKDMSYSVYRYFINRFVDGKYHNTLNLVTGNWIKGEIKSEMRFISIREIFTLKILVLIPLLLILLRKLNSKTRPVAILLLLMYIFIVVLKIDLPSCGIIDSN